MALTGTDRGVGSHNSSATSFTLSPSGNFAAGSMGVLCVASDNAGTSGAAQTITVTDDIGNTWTRQVSALVNPGQNLGQEGSIFTTPQDIGPLQSSTVITVTFGAATVAKTWTLMEVAAAAGAVPLVVPVATGTATGGTGTTSPTTGTIPAASCPPGRMLIAALFLEAGTTETITGDADTTNGSWSTQQTAEVGTTTSGSNIASQRKILTARGTQTYNPTLGILGDSCTGWIVIHEALTTGYEAAVRADSPLALWRLGEASGAFTYDAIGVAEQDVVNTPTMGVTGLLTGDSNTAYTCARASLEYTASGVASVPAGSATGVSIEAWVRFDTVTAATIYGFVRWNSTGTVTDTALRYYVALNALRYFYQDATTNRNVISDAWTPTVGTIYHIVVTHDYSAEQVRFYVNGSLLSLEDVSANGVPVTHPASFVSLARAASDYHDGTIDEVALYSTVLSSTRILAHYNAGLGIGTQDISPALLDQTAATFSPTVAQQQFYTPALISQAAATFAPVVTQQQFYTPALLSQIAATFAPAVTPGVASISVGVIASTHALYAPSLALGIGQAVWTTPLDGVGIGTTPALTFTMPTGSANFMHFQMELDDNSGFSSPVVIDSSSSQVGWEYWNGSAWTAVPSGGVNQSFGGNEARHTVQSPLTTGTYYRRVRAGVVD